MSMLEMYLLVKLDDIQDVATVFAVFSTVALLFCILFPIVEAQTASPSLVKFTKKLVVLVAILVPLATLLPTTKQMAAILIVPAITSKVAESDGLQKLPSKLLKLADEWIDELGPSKKDGK